jgi:hypothetical protein
VQARRQPLEQGPPQLALPQEPLAAVSSKERLQARCGTCGVLGAGSKLWWCVASSCAWRMMRSCWGRACPPRAACCFGEGAVGARGGWAEALVTRTWCEGIGVPAASGCSPVMVGVVLRKRRDALIISQRNASHPRWSHSAQMRPLPAVRECRHTRHHPPTHHVRRTSFQRPPTFDLQGFATAASHRSAF